MITVKTEDSFALLVSLSTTSSTHGYKYRERVLLFSTTLRIQSGVNAIQTMAFLKNNQAAPISPTDKAEIHETSGFSTCQARIFQTDSCLSEQVPTHPIERSATHLTEYLQF